MSGTPRLALPLIEAAQAQKHVTHNEALVGFDTLVNLRVLDRDLTAPAGGEADGDAYIVASSATGDWKGEDGQIAAKIDGGWRFHTPFDGLIAFVVDEEALIVFSDGSWNNFASFLWLQNLSMLGVGTTVSEIQRLSVKSDEVIYSHDDVTPGNGNMVVTLNKAVDANDAGHAFKIGWEARALAGLFSDGDYQIKVSPDGATFTTALSIDHATGLIGFRAGISGVREALTANRIYYVDATSGNDTNDGRTSASAFATIQRAVDEVATIDMAGNVATISIAAGTYAENVGLTDLVGGPCYIIGDETTPSNVLLSPAIGIAITAANVVGSWYLRGFKIEGAGLSRGIQSNSARFTFRNLDFGAIETVSHYCHIFPWELAYFEAAGDYTISGGSGCHI
ncbi:DUF2793 domain-containing protein [Breoghania sp.]|uniref:DUF2793 domain-containing protein n=1 Tax=Breoghania sp. TaxID=2065378 RepID=UPI00262899C7|nr:DUF2793 domain-containing protein [Breoghania sp.]MDJ0931837.1 DUF2793 domain-containing protein [Breoghania sp.]